MIKEKYGIILLQVKKIRYNAQYTARFENGLIVEMWATCDGHTILKQIGII